MGQPIPDMEASEKPSTERLDSWKEIAAYLKRDVTTAQRWEKREGMPVHRHLHERRGSVYALTSELDTWLQARGAGLAGEETGTGQEALTAAGAEPKEGATSGGRLPLFLACLSALAVLAVVIILARGRLRNVPRPKIRSLAVLPLKNLSGDPNQEYLADGMTEALIGRLAGIRDLRVVSHTSVMRFKNPQMSVQEIARTLGVDAIVEGSVIREGNRVRVTAQLIRGATDEHFWSETYDREFRDVLVLQSDVAQSIAEKVQATVTGEEQERLAAARPVAPEVYESYLQGWSLLNGSDKKAEIERAMGFFNDAIKKDPTFAPAYVGLAMGYGLLGSNYVGESPDAALEEMSNSVRKALELDPNLAQAHDARGDIEMQRWQWAEAEADYRSALDLNPNSADANWELASWLLWQGRVDEALSRMQHARELDPLEIDGTVVGTMLAEAGRYNDSLHELRSVLAVQPDDSVTLWDLGITLTNANQPANAIPVLEKAVRLSNRSPGVIGALARACALAGRREDALRLVAELENRKKRGYVPSSAFVNAYLGLGDYDRAFDWLDQGYREHSNILERLKVDHLFDPIRGDPRFADLLHRVGLE